MGAVHRGAAVGSEKIREAGSGLGGRPGSLVRVEMGQGFVDRQDFLLYGNQWRRKFRGGDGPLGQVLQEDQGGCGPKRLLDVTLGLTERDLGGKKEMKKKRKRLEKALRLSRLSSQQKLVVTGTGSGVSLGLSPSSSWLVTQGRCLNLSVLPCSDPPHAGVEEAGVF